MHDERQFPILHPAKDGVLWLPWAMLEEHEEQAKKNHGGQTLTRLAERGGLGASEAVAILEGRDWHPLLHADARLAEMIEEWLNAD
jgi:hypothetical protein